MPSDPVPAASPNLPPGCPPFRASSQADQTERFHQALDTVSRGTLIAVPLLLLIPPRKIDLYTFSLCGAFIFAASHQTKVQTGDGLLIWLGKKRAHQLTAETEVYKTLPLVEERSVVTSATGPPQTIKHFIEDGRQSAVWDVWAEESNAFLGADGQARLLKMTSARNPADKAEKPSYNRNDSLGWRNQQARLDTEVAGEAKSVGDKITAQIWEVWNWDAATENEGRGKWKDTS